MSTVKEKLVANAKNVQSSGLRSSLISAAKSLSERPKELRGPFAVRSAGSTASAVKTK